MSTAQNLVMTEQEYLEGELHSEIKHEFIDGQAYAMTGTSDDHNRIACNMLIALGVHLNGSPCKPFMADIKLKAARNIFYPDLMVTCEQDESDTKPVKHAPVIVVEVRSPSTRKTDVTIKKNAYISLPSLQEYIVIEQDKCEIQVFRRKDSWQSSYYFLPDVIELESVGKSLPVEDVYDPVENEDVAAFRAGQ